MLAEAEPPDRMGRVLATGTFDVLHPGHVHFLEEAAALGDELAVIVARTSMIDQKAPPVIPDEQRRAMVGSLDPVDRAVLGSESSIYEPLEEIDPAVVAMGHDQGYSTTALEERLATNGFDVEVVRVGRAEPPEGMIYSTSGIIDRVIAARGGRHGAEDAATATAIPPLFR